MKDNFLNRYLARFDRVEEKRKGKPRQVALELKFPLVAREDGRACGRESVAALWAYLETQGWKPIRDSHSGRIVGAELIQGDKTDTLSSATGYCVIELSTAPEYGLLELQARVAKALRPVLSFCREAGLVLLGHGIHPVSRPSPELLTQKGRNLFWDDIFVHQDAGARVHLFSATAASQVHIDVSTKEAGDALAVFNGLAPAQIALNGNSGVWANAPDAAYKCVHEHFWDRWMPHEDRVGMPAAKPQQLTDYLQHLMALRPVYVERDGTPVMLPDIGSFEEFLAADEVAGKRQDDTPVVVAPRQEDLDLHLTFCWHNARISRYCTLENRVNCQQPQEALLAIGALAAGLAARLGEARALVDDYDWSELLRARPEAMARGLQAKVGSRPIAQLAAEMLKISEQGLKQRDSAEAELLAPLWQRLERKMNPADEAAAAFEVYGIGGLLDRFSVTRICSK